MRGPRALSSNPMENAQAAWEKLNATKRRQRITAISLIAAVAVISVISIVMNLASPSGIRQLREQVAAQQQRLGQLTNQFPVDSVEFQALAAVTICVNYTDQASDSQVAIVQSKCGWNGAGVANNADLRFNRNQALRTPLTRDGFSGLPFEARFLGSGKWLRYWVPVRRHGKGAAVAGMPVPLSSQPTFVLNGCSADSNSPADAATAAIQQLVRGARRYAMPGLHLAFNGNGLSRAHADSVQLCGKQSGVTTLIAKVTYNGPTAGAQLSVWYAFRTQVISTEETRVSGVGLFVGTPPGA